MLLLIVFTSVVSGSGQCIRRWEIYCWVQWWMVSLDGIFPGSLVTSIHGLNHLAHMEGTSLERFHHDVYYHVDCIIAYSDMNLLGGLCLCGNLFHRDCWNLHNYWHLWERDSCCKWMKTNCWCPPCYIRVLEGNVMVTHVWCSSSQSSMDVNHEGHRESSSSCIMSNALKLWPQAPSSISTSVFLVQAPLWIIMWLMLL